MCLLVDHDELVGEGNDSLKEIFGFEVFIFPEHLAHSLDIVLQTTVKKVKFLDLR